MSLDTLLHSCLQVKTSFAEKGKSVSISRGDDEIILMFHTDCDAARKALKIEKACDVTFLYMKHQQRPIFIFVELKGKDISRAAEQIKSTIDGLRRLLKQAISPHYPNNEDLRAIVVRSGSTPRDLSRIHDKFFSDTGVKLQFGRQAADLRRFVG
jgi:hypothetical protein